MQRSFSLKILFNQYQIPDDKQDFKKVMASQDLDILNAVKCFAYIHGDYPMNVMLNQLMGKEEIPKLLDKVLFICFFKK